MLLPDDPVQDGMHVDAKYRDLDVHFRINRWEEQHHAYLSEVLFFEPVNDPKPADPSIGDVVLIDRQHICCMYDEP
jgi:hypothetical protein